MSVPSAVGRSDGLVLYRPRWVTFGVPEKAYT